MANGNKKEKYFSDIIGTSYKDWKNTQVIFDGGTGTGKTYFIVNILGKYARETGKKIIYLCNRSKLKKQTYENVEALNLQDVIYVTTYQALQSKIKCKKEIGYFDYIISDECHYFTNDALFNEYTDLAYDFIWRQKESVIIYISATAKVFFYWLKKEKSDIPCFEIPKSYDYVDNVYFYDKKLLIPKVDSILENEPDSKIIIFCNSISRMSELYEKYGTKANYIASKNARKVQEICDDNCIYEHDDGSVTFDKRILITTKVLDNGVDIKDKKVKHIFSEILDVDSAIQALGRKRKISDDDHCTFYIKNYTGQALQGLINTNECQTEPVMLYRTNYEVFWEKYGYNRKMLRTNKIFYTQFDPEKEKNKLRYNRMRLKKYLMDTDTLRDMKESSYKNIMMCLLGEELASKSLDLDMQFKETDEFLEYLKSIEGKWLYADDRKKIVKRFEDIGVKLRRAGINTLNGALADQYEKQYKCRFRNKQLDSNGKLTRKNLVDNRKILLDGSINPMRNKTYWILE